MQNTITRMLLEDQVMIYASDTTQLVADAKELHGTYPVATAALGRTLTAASMMGSQLKEKGQILTININGGGPAGTVMATADSEGNVKGCIGNPYVNLPARPDGKLDVGGAVGKDGFLTVSKDIGLKEPYVGTVQLVSGEIAEDVATYYLKSEQQPTIVYLSVWVDVDTSVLRAGGLIISPLPNATDGILDVVESKLFGIENYALSIMQNTPKQALEKIFAGMDLKELETIHPAYRCDCSRERLEQVILSLGKDEIQKIIEEDGQAEVVCRFCNKKYQFGREDLQRLLELAEKGE